MESSYLWGLATGIVIREEGGSQEEEIVCSGVKRGVRHRKTQVNKMKCFYCLECRGWQVRWGW